MQKEHRDYRSEDLRSFGRVRARKHSARQNRLLNEVLSDYLVDCTFHQKVSPDSMFINPPKDLWLEIGFGGAEHLIEQAKLYPDVGFIGSEPFQGGIIKALSAIDNECIENIRLYNADVRPLLRSMQQCILGRIFILFPDPWPKARHAKRRLFNSDFVNLITHVMKPGAELRVATDIKSYAQQIFEVCLENANFVKQTWIEEIFQKPWSDWRGTRYERKALKEGRSPLYLTFVRAGGGV